MHEISKLIPKRSRNAHKGSCGDVFIVAGSAGMSGAAILTSLSALRSGSGMVKLALPKSIQLYVDVVLREVITYAVPEDSLIQISKNAGSAILKNAARSDVMVVGPGIKNSPILKQLIKWGKPILIDADGLNSIAANPRIIKQFKGPVIITPHPGELARLLNCEIKDIQKNRVQAAQNAAGKWGVICVLKGAGTVVACSNKKTYVNKTGNPGMATAGSGDVLAGMIAAFISQRVSAFEAAILGVYLHGLAGDIALKSTGIHGLIASDIIEHIPKAIIKCKTK